MLLFANFMVLTRDTTFTPLQRLSILKARVWSFVKQWLGCTSRCLILGRWQDCYMAGGSVGQNLVKIKRKCPFGRRTIKFDPFPSSMLFFIKKGLFSCKVISEFAYLLCYYLANKQSLHVRSHGLEIPTLIRENKRNWNYPPLALRNRSKIPLCLTKYSTLCHYKETNPIRNIVIRFQTTSVG